MAANKTQKRGFSNERKACSPDIGPDSRPHLFRAFAADSRIESMEYEGFGILKIEFTRACDWYTSSTITLTDAGGISHDDERCPGK